MRAPSGRCAGHDLRAAVLTDTWSAVGLRLGMLDLVPTAREADLVGHLGPDVLGPDWDADGRGRRGSRHPPGFVGDVLLDQRVLAGVGTFWASEILFLERVLPWTPGRRPRPRERRAAMLERLHRLMDAGPAHRAGRRAPASSAPARRPTCTPARGGRAAAAATPCASR